MKKKVLEKLEEKKISTDGLKKLRPLLKDIDVKSNKIKMDDMYSTWPITCIIDKDTDLKLGLNSLGLLNKKGFYYCGLQGAMEDNKELVYLAFYNDMKVKDLLFADEEASIEPHSFYSFGIRSDFEMYSILDSLLLTDDNFVEIIDDKMKKSKKQTKKIIKKQKNQK